MIIVIFFAVSSFRVACNGWRYEMERIAKRGHINREYFAIGEVVAVCTSPRSVL